LLGVQGAATDRPKRLKSQTSQQQGGEEGSNTEAPEEETTDTDEEQPEPEPTEEVDQPERRSRSPGAVPK